MKKNMEVYTIDTTGGQITGMEAIRGEIPAWLAAVVADRFREYGYCYWRDADGECIMYPTREAAEHAIRWTVEN